MRLPINAIITRKYFHRDHYRRSTYFLYASLIISILLLAGIFFLLTMRKEQDFYASNGIVTPVLLESLNTTNMAAQQAKNMEDEVTRNEANKVVGE